MLPLPAAVHVPPPAPTHVHVAVRLAGSVSLTLEPGALFGPALVAVIVYVTAPPGVAVVTPSVLVIARSAVAPPAMAAELATSPSKTTAEQDLIRCIDSPRATHAVACGGIA